MTDRVADADRGEHELTLAGETYLLRPSFAAMKAIEKKLDGASVLALFRRANVGALSLTELGTIAAELIRAGAEDEFTRKVSADRIGELIYEEGVASALARVTLCLHDGITGGRTALGEAKAVASAPMKGDATAG